MLKRIYHFIGNILHINHLATRITNLENNLSAVSDSLESDGTQANEHFRELESRLYVAEIREQQAKYSALHGAISRFEDQLIECCSSHHKRFADYSSVFETVRRSGGESLYVLDLGCGRGHWLEILEKEGHINAVGVDIVPEYIHECLNKDLQAVHADILSYLQHCQSSSADVVTMLHVAEFLSLDKLIAVLKEISRVLRPAGALILELPDPEKASGQHYCAFCDPSLVTVIRPDILSLLIRQARLIPSETLRFAPYSADSISASALRKLNESGLAFDSAFGPFAEYAVVACKSV